MPNYTLSFKEGSFNMLHIHELKEYLNFCKEQTNAHVKKYVLSRILFSV
jgi:hypothetical protein